MRAGLFVENRAKPVGKTFHFFECVRSGGKGLLLGRREVGQRIADESLVGTSDYFFGARSAAPSGAQGGDRRHGSPMRST
jgi:hypothetical protein